LTVLGVVPDIGHCSPRLSNAHFYRTAPTTFSRIVCCARSEQTAQRRSNRRIGELLAALGQEQPPVILFVECPLFEGACKPIGKDAHNECKTVPQGSRIASYRRGTGRIADDAGLLPRGAWRWRNPTSQTASSYPISAGRTTIVGARCEGLRPKVSAPGLRDVSAAQR
jgi:hypothetical protein